MKTILSNSASTLAFRLLWLATPVGFLSCAWATDIQVKVADQRGRPIEGAVVWVDEPAKNLSPLDVEISQKNRQFHPEVTVIPVGSKVRFPNRDSVQHHVYSFSPAKSFDIPLYIGEAANPVTFDRPGVVTLGCNIHDWMSASILILETIRFTKTNASGIATLKDLPASTRALKIWHPRLRGDPVAWTPEEGESASQAAVTLTLRPAFPRTPPQDEGGTYR